MKGGMYVIYKDNEPVYVTAIADDAERYCSKMGFGCVYLWVPFLKK